MSKAESKTVDIPLAVMGDIFDLKDGIICHQVNCKGVMGAGLAMAIRNKWPQVYTDYMETYKRGVLHLGTVVWTKVDEALWVASLAAQDGYGRVKGQVYTNYVALQTCLQVVDATAVLPIAIPKGMGCALGGGDWAIVERIIKENMSHAIIADKGDDTVSITCFAGAHHFLSNFENSVIQLPLDQGQRAVACQDTIIFKTVEHYYQAMKSNNILDWVIISQCTTPGQAKRAGRKLRMRFDWDNIKLGVMETGLDAKFQIPELRDKLLATGNAMLIEGNSWNDTYWGMCRGVGENHLGKLLMKIRGAIKAS